MFPVVRTALRTAAGVSYRRAVVAGTTLHTCPSRPGNSILYSTAAANYKDLDIKRIKTGIKDGDLVLVDIRNKNETESTGVIPSAIKIPLGELSSAFHLSETEFSEKYKAKKPNANDSIAVYCRSGMRAMTAYDALKGLGYQQVWRYPGSWLDWADNHPGTKREPGDK